MSEKILHISSVHINKNHLNTMGSFNLSKNNHKMYLMVLKDKEILKPYIFIHTYLFIFGRVLSVIV